jgi:hypothetical protein
MNMEIASRDDDASRIFEMNFIAESRLKNSYLIKQKNMQVRARRQRGGAFLTP